MNRLSSEKCPRPKAAEYTLNRVYGLKAFLFDSRIEIDNNPAENATFERGSQKLAFLVSEAGAKARMQSV